MASARQTAYNAVVQGGNIFPPIMARLAQPARCLVSTRNGNPLSAGLGGVCRPAASFVASKLDATIPILWMAEIERSAEPSNALRFNLGKFLHWVGMSVFWLIYGHHGGTNQRPLAGNCRSGCRAARSCARSAGTGLMASFAVRVGIVPVPAFRKRAWSTRQCLENCAPWRQCLCGLQHHRRH